METLKTLGKLDTLLLADFILFHYSPMSHLKLQKLLYYCEAYHLAYFENSLIDSEFQAWVHGPVSPKLYRSFRDDSVLYSDIMYNKEKDPSKEVNDTLTSDQLDLLKEILSELSTWTGFQLEHITHKEKPWLEARIGYAPGEICDVVISKKTMRGYYKQYLNG